MVNMKYKDIEGQISIFEYLEEKNRVCNFSQHTCNKTELWKIAHTFDDFVCPEVCCRTCKVSFCGARCNGSEEPERIFPVDARGICDDAYCPKCNYCLDELKELDCKVCPVCGVKIDWGPWHRLND